jgi:hypothetical protein
MSARFSCLPSHVHWFWSLTFQINTFHADHTRSYITHLHTTSHTYTKSLHSRTRRLTQDCYVSFVRVMYPLHCHSMSRWWPSLFKQKQMLQLTANLAIYRGLHMLCAVILNACLHNICKLYYVHSVVQGTAIHIFRQFLKVKLRKETRSWVAGFMENWLKELPLKSSLIPWRLFNFRLTYNEYFVYFRATYALNLYVPLQSCPHYWSRVLWKKRSLLFCRQKSMQF